MAAADNENVQRVAAGFGRGFRAGIHERLIVTAAEEARGASVHDKRGADAAVLLNLAGAVEVERVELRVALVAKFFRDGANARARRGWNTRVISQRERHRGDLH